MLRGRSGPCLFPLALSPLHTFYSTSQCQWTYSPPLPSPSLSFFLPLSEFLLFGWSFLPSADPVPVLAPASTQYLISSTSPSTRPPDEVRRKDQGSDLHPERAGHRGGPPLTTPSRTPLCFCLLLRFFPPIYRPRSRPRTYSSPSSRFLFPGSCCSTVPAPDQAPTPSFQPNPSTSTTSSPKPNTNPGFSRSQIQHQQQPWTQPQPTTTATSIQQL